MPKAILELDMPVSCRWCPCSYEDNGNKMWCDAIYIIEYREAECPGRGRRSDCPLKLVEEKEGCEECNGVAGMELPLSAGIQKVYYCPMCGRKL